MDELFFLENGGKIFEIIPATFRKIMKLD